jgi:hypothetical protein
MSGFHSLYIYIYTHIYIYIYIYICVYKNVKHTYIYIYIYIYIYYMGTAVAQRLRFCATNRKVAGSIPDGVVEFFIDINPSDRTMALGSTQPLTEMSSRCISWG